MLGAINAKRLGQVSLESPLLESCVGICARRPTGRIRRPARLGPLRFNFSKGGPQLDLRGRARCFVQHSGEPLQDQCDGRPDQSVSRTWPSTGNGMNTELVSPMGNGRGPEEIKNAPNELSRT